jgi:sec-independent protein translocase protein TatC
MAFKLFNRNPNQTEMSFVDHLEALRWHIVRSFLAILVVAIILFIKMNWFFDKVILGPLRKDFISYTGLCQLGRMLHMGDVLCMPPVNIKMQTTTLNLFPALPWPSWVALWLLFLMYSGNSGDL